MSVSAFEQEQRRQLVVPWTLFAGDAANIDVTPGNDYPVLVEQDAKITRLSAVAQGITGSSQIVVELLRGAGVLTTLTSAVPYVAGVIVLSGTIDVNIYKDETLICRVRASDADTDDVTGLRIQARLQILADQDDS